jgi:photosystem II stability/assembly factor-like uncharacterized protein
MKNLLLLLVLAIPISSQWIKQNVNTTASLRGLSVVNEKVVWASGTGGTVIRTIDGGMTWNVMTVPGAEKLDFRDIEAFDGNSAYVLSIGNGESSRIYKTVDGGKTWQLEFQNNNPKAFFDAIACWDKNNCVAMSDPVNRRFVLIQTKDGGKSWTPMDTSKMPEAKEGEAAFAASGTCLVTQGKKNLFLVTGGSDARVFRSNDRGITWSVAETPIVRGTPGSGIFSIAMFNDRKGVFVGGNYEKDKETGENRGFTSDGGLTWIRGGAIHGYRSAVIYVDESTMIAVGSSGSDVSLDGGNSWNNIDVENYNSVNSKGKSATWAVGAKGLVAKYSFVNLLNLIKTEPF